MDKEVGQSELTVHEVKPDSNCNYCYGRGWTKFHSGYFPCACLIKRMNKLKNISNISEVSLKVTLKG